MTRPSLRPDPPRLLIDSTAEEDGLALDLAVLNYDVATLRNEIVALVRARLKATKAVQDVGGLDGADMILFGDQLDDGLSDLAWPARQWINNRLEEL